MNMQLTLGNPTQIVDMVTICWVSARKGVPTEVPIPGRQLRNAEVTTQVRV